MDKRIFGVIAWIFVLGWICGSVYSASLSPADGAPVESPSFAPNQDIKSPYDWISEEDIEIFDDRVIISINDPQWAKFAPTRSMDPVIDEGAHAIQIVPKSPDDIHEGDIISYESPSVGGVVIHRVSRVGHDENGWYAITKGDNNSVQDPGKVRFSQVKKVLVAIIY